MNNHTPGPWIAKQAHINTMLIYSEDHTPIAEVWTHGPNCEREANANLIAAAPDLLEALGQVIELAWRDHKTEEEQALLEQTDRLIAKAKGETK